jgi:hypothetical protein
MNHCNRCGVEIDEEGRNWVKSTSSVGGVLWWCSPCWQAYNEEERARGDSESPWAGHLRHALVVLVMLLALAALIWWGGR